MDFLAELGLAPLPAAPAGGLASSASDAPTGIDASFAAYMRQPVEGAPVEPGATAVLSADRRGSGQLLDLADLDGLTLSGQPAARTEVKQDAQPEGQVLKPNLAPSSETLVRDGVTPRVGAATTASELDATPTGDEVATLEAPEKPGRDRPAGGKPEGAVADSGAMPESPILVPNPPVPTPTEPRLPSAKEGEPADGPAPHHSTTSTPTVHGNDAAPHSASSVADSDVPTVAVAVASPQQQQQPTGADRSSDANASAPLNSAGATAVGQEVALTGAHGVARRGEPRQSLNSAPDAGDDGDPPSLEKPAEAKRGTASPVKGSEEGGSKQPPSSDSQIGRLPNSLGLQGNTGAPPHPASGPLSDSGLVIIRGHDGAVTVHAPAHHHQMALHITKILDHDKTAIRIELDPSDLGDVDIDLEFHDLRLTATIRAERSDVLDLLQRDVRTLARALREAGVELTDSDISFSQGGRGDHGGYGASANRAIALPSAFATAGPLQDLPVAPASREGFVSLSDGRMDLRV